MRDALMIVLVWLISCTPVCAQQAPNGAFEYELTVAARRIETPVLKNRLLPAEYELRDGNAATIVLRLPWDQTPYFSDVVPKFRQFLEVPLSDRDRIRSAGAGLSPHFYDELRRAAYRRTADWQYPLDQKPISEILLPDVQGSRAIFRGLSVWIRFQIVEGRLDEAREGILVGLANSRHYARTPFVICSLVAATNANMMLDRLQELLQQADCPNLYWPLTNLGAPFLSVHAAFEYERDSLQRSVDGLDDLQQLRSEKQWEQLADRTTQFVAPQLGSLLGVPGETATRPANDDGPTGRKRMLEFARKDLPKLQPDLTKQIGGMCDGELCVRWLLSLNNDAWDRISAAAALGIPEAIAHLRLIKGELATAGRDDGPQMIWGSALGYYLSSVRFDRRVAALRVVEAVRHYAATHDGQLPQKLAQITETPIPHDPFTGKPFEYNAEPDSFSISAAAIDGGGESGKSMVFEVLMKGN